MLSVEDVTKVHVTAGMLVLILALSFGSIVSDSFATSFALIPGK